jgi:hypothetical protein
MYVRISASADLPIAERDLTAIFDAVHPEQQWRIRKLLAASGEQRCV